MRVLIVDDSRVMRTIVVNAIKENSGRAVEFSEAENGAKALKVLDEHRIDLICVDWNMPSLSGLGLVKKIRAMKDHKTLPIIMITSEAAKYMIVEAARAGVTDYLIKPFVGKKLWEKLEIYFK